MIFFFFPQFIGPSLHRRVRLVVDIVRRIGRKQIYVLCCMKALVSTTYLTGTCESKYVLFPSF